MNHSFLPIGDGGCKVISFLSITSLTVSAFTLVVISIDRYVIVKWPLHERHSVWKVFSVYSSNVVGCQWSWVHLFSSR